MLRHRLVCGLLLIFVCLCAPQVVVEEQDEATRRTASDMAREWGLDKRLVPQLDRHGVASFFAVQCRVLPYLISTQQADLVRDVVVSAPTGSGKTLVYVLALLQVRARNIHYYAEFPLT